MISKIVNQFIYQFGNFLLPLLLIPFLINKLSPEVYQELIVLQSVVMLSALIINYGFELKGTSHISINQADNHSCQDYVLSAFILKIGLFFITSLLFLMIVFLGFELPVSLILCCLFWMFSYCIQFNWFFQGVGDFATITRLGVLPKLVIIPMIFLTVNGDNSAWYYLFFNAISVFVCNFLMTKKMWARLQLNLMCLTRQKLANVYFILNDGFSVFMSQISTALLNNVNVFILPLLIDPLAFVIFNTAEKICRVVAVFTTPFTNVLYPYVSKNIKDKDFVFKLINKIVLTAVITYSFFYLIFYNYGDLFTDYAFPKFSEDLQMSLNFLLFTPIMIFCNNLFGTQIGLNLGEDKLFAKVILFGGVTNVIFIIVLSFNFGLYGAIGASLLSQTLILIGMYGVANKNGYKF